jgi:two-component system phosphate regulon sensor histidine kinase PhoR
MPRLVNLLRRRIALKLTITLVGFVALVLFVAGVYLSLALQSFAEDAVEAQLQTAARLLHDEARMLVVGDAPATALQAFVMRAARPTESRVTLVGRDGRVLADSGVPFDDVPRLDNHADRPEVKAALAGRIGRDLRSSATVREPLFYVGLPITDGGRVAGVLRVALPLSVVTESHRAVGHVLLVGGLVALGIAAGIGVFVSRRITRPVVEMQRTAARMSEGDFRTRAPVRSTDEIGMLARALNAMSASLRDKIDDLEQEHAKVTTILDAMVEGVVAVDGHDEILLINEPARAMFDVPPGRGEGKPLLEVVRNADLHAVARRARGVAESAAMRREVVIDGGSSRRTLDVHAMPLRLGAGPLGVVMVLDDVTELRRLERVRTEFVANVSHELRTPLTAIQGYVETLLGGAIDEPADSRRFLEVVHRHTERLGRLLNDLTDLSNIELGRITLDLGPVPVAEVAESVVAILRPRADAGHVALDLDVAPDLPAVHADHDRLHQILINLVDNAVKYTPPGGRVTVTARANDSGVDLAVADTGVGIPAADLPRITERFYRVDKARSRELGGTGLGLAIVKHLVQAHAGELAIESDYGRGTTVRVRLLCSRPT